MSQLDEEYESRERGMWLSNFSTGFEFAGISLFYLMALLIVGWVTVVAVYLSLGDTAALITALFIVGGGLRSTSVVPGHRSISTWLRLRWDYRVCQKSYLPDTSGRIRRTDDGLTGEDEDDDLDDHYPASIRDAHKRKREREREGRDDEPAGESEADSTASEPTDDTTETS